MPQSPVIQTAAPKAPPQAKPSGSPGSKEQSRFSPHLERAISGKKIDRQADREKIAAKESAQTDKNQPAELTEEIGKSPESKKSVRKTEAKAADEAVTDSSKERLDQAFPTPFYTESSPAAAPETATATKAAEAAVTTTPAVKVATKVALSATDLQDEVSLLERADSATKTRSASAGTQDTLISQLQKIIGNSNEKETVSIKRADNSIAAGSKANDIPAAPFTVLGQTGTAADAQAETGTAGRPFASLLHGAGPESLSAGTKSVEGSATSLTPESAINGLFAAAGDNSEKVAGKPMEHLTANRHGVQQQFVDAKISRQNPAENQQNFQEHRQEDKLAQQTSSSGPSTGLSTATDQTSTFSQIVTASQPATAQAPVVTAAPMIILPSGTVVHEDEIIRQMTEKFQVSGKHTDSRINIKLHPAELGSLKIDLSVKEGSIRANVVAQSHHTMQILEKNIQKLRAVLENQGFTVDQIAVSAESDSVAGFDLFDRQFFNKNDQPPATPQARRTGKAAFALEDGIHPAWATSSGVNVKI